MDADDTTLTSAVKYDTNSEQEGKTNNNVRDLGLNFATTPHDSSLGPWDTSLSLSGNHSLGNSHRYVQTGKAVAIRCYNSFRLLLRLFLLCSRERGTVTRILLF